MRWITVQVSPPGTLISVPTCVFEVVATVAVRVNESVQTAIVIQTRSQDLITGPRPSSVNFCHRPPTARFFDYLCLSLSLFFSLFFLLFYYSILNKKNENTHRIIELGSRLKFTPFHTFVSNSLPNSLPP